MSLQQLLTSYMQILYYYHNIKNKRQTPKNWTLPFAYSKVIIRHSRTIPQYQMVA